jgi:hypothetical protein
MDGTELAEHTTDLVAFVRARLDEEEHLAREAGLTNGLHIATWTAPCSAELLNLPHEAPCECCRITGDNINIYDEGEHDRSQALHIATWDPTRVLADIEAKRVLVDAYVTAKASHQWWSDSEQPSESGLAVASASLSEWIVVLRTLASMWSTHPDYPTEPRQDPDVPGTAEQEVT